MSQNGARAALEAFAADLPMAGSQDFGGAKYGIVARDGDLAACTDAVVHAATAERGRLVPLLASVDPSFAVVAA